MRWSILFRWAICTIDHHFNYLFGGGTGSGLTSLFLQNAYDLLAGMSLQTYSVYPEKSSSEIVEGNFKKTHKWSSKPPKFGTKTEFSDQIIKNQQMSWFVW